LEFTNWVLLGWDSFNGIHSSGIDVQSAADAVKIIKQAMEVRLGPPQAVMFLSRAVKRTKLKTEAMELLGKLAPTIKPCSNR
jgi:chromosome partitioning protein